MLAFRLRWLFLLLVLPASVARADLMGPVVGVTDGDTIKVLRNKEEVKIRLHGIDAPEKKQPFGQKAKQYASDLVFGKTVRVEEKDTDRYGRIVGEVFLPDGTCLNHEMVKAGLAWWYRKYAPDDEILATLEDEARRANRGLWSDPAPVSPWEWRRKKSPRSSHKDS